MRIDIVFPKLPPALDGIGDYTAHLAASLAHSSTEVRVITAQKQAAHIDGVEVVEGFSDSLPSSIREIGPVVRAAPPDWLVLQYNPFSYGRWGLNLSLPEAVARLKRNCDRLKIAVMIHEPFVPVNNWRFAIMTTWQRWQLRRLGSVADLVLCAIEPWVQKLRPYVPKAVPLVSLPVGSNIPDAGFNRDEARAWLGIPSEELVVGMFGSARRQLNLLRAALVSLSRSLAFRTVYVGPDGSSLHDAIEGVAISDLGPLPAPQVSQALRAMDIHLVPYPRGVSARRGAFIAGLHHGIPSVSTIGSHTDSFLAQSSGEAFMLTSEGDSDAFAAAVTMLAGNPDQRYRMAQMARSFHDEHFAWDRIASCLLHALESAAGSDSSAMRSGLEQERLSCSP